MHAALCYKLVRLFYICAHHAVDALSVSNAAMTLTLTEKLPEGCVKFALKTAALRFVSENAPAVMKTAGWIKLGAEAPALKDELLLLMAA